MVRDRLLSLSQAARLVGVKRTALQEHIQQGRLSVFEGYVRLSALLDLYPDVSADESGMIEKVRRIKDVALFKYNREGPVDAEQLAAEAQRLRVQLAEAHSELESYRKLTGELKARLLYLQENCDHKQGLVVSALVSWFMHQMKLRSQ